MKNLRVLLLALSLGLTPALAWAAGWLPLAAPMAYIGPGDILIYTSYYALRSYNSATRGSKLINACNSTGGADVGCADLFSNASTGLIVPATISGITCPGANCTVKIFYDLAGGGADRTQATVANRFTLPSTGCVGVSGSKPCSVAAGTGGYPSAINSPWNSPSFMTYIGDSASGAAQQSLVCSNNVNFCLFAQGANTVKITGDASGTLNATASQGAIHGISGLANVASSFIVVDAGAPVTGTLGSTPVTTLSWIGSDGFASVKSSGSVFLEGGFLFSN